MRAGIVDYTAGFVIVIFHLILMGWQERKGIV
jgi:hypothetical protein